MRGFFLILMIIFVFILEIIAPLCVLIGFIWLIMQIIQQSNLMFTLFII